MATDSNMALSSHSMIVINEPWFIPFDIMMIVWCAVAIACFSIFLIVIICDRTCHTVTMMLVAHSCLCECVFSMDVLAMVVFTFQNDLKRLAAVDSLCITRGFIGYIATFLQNHSYLLQAIFRYLKVVYPHRAFLQSARFQLLLVLITWICSVVCTIPYVITNEIKYNTDNQICQMPLQLSFLTIYNAMCVYMIPISLTMLLYYKLVRYVHKMGERATPMNTLSRAQRELRMVRRIVILISSVAAIGFPYALFIFVSFFTSPPKYHFRIAYIFVDLSLLFVVAGLFRFTEPLRTSITKGMKTRVNAVIPMVAWVPGPPITTR
jgi:hypothetical protein